MKVLCGTSVQVDVTEKAGRPRLRVIRKIPTLTHIARETRSSGLALLKAPKCYRIFGRSLSTTGTTTSSSIPLLAA